MPQDNVSRRRFLQNVAAGSTAAAFASVPGVLDARRDDLLGAPEPVRVESYPVAEPGKGAGVSHVKIVTQEQIPEDYREKLQSLAAGLDLRQCASESEFRHELADAHVIYGHFSREDLKVARQLKWVQYAAAGVEDILWPELVESPLVLTNMARVYAPAISETVMGLLLALAHSINRHALQTPEHVWKRLEGLTDISGWTMGIVGLGGIGTETAYRAHYGFGMKIYAADPKPLPKPAFVAELHSVECLPQMVPEVDVLVSAAPHTPASEGMFNESIFRAMKRSAYFINVSRGKLVDTPALVRALKEGWIAGAGLDVTYKEPLPAGESLWTAGNLIVTCHTSGRTPRTLERQMALFTENVRRYVNGLPLLNVVDRRPGY